jgi:hypothetical protein
VGNSLIAVLASNKDGSTLEDTQARRDRDRIEVFDRQRPDILPFVIDDDLEQIPIFRLHEEEECSLKPTISDRLSVTVESPTRILCMTAATMITPLLLSPFCAKGFRRRGMGIR